MSGTQKQQQSKQTQTKVNAKKTPSQPEQSVNLEQLVNAPETMRSADVIAAQKRAGNQVVQRALDGKKKRDSMTDEQGYLKGEINDAIQKKRGGGSPLPDSLRGEASKRLGHDFDNVRIHTDEQANELSQSINARAFTIGKDIFFKKGVFSPGSRAGRETLMHELTHVVQQSGGGGGNGRLKLGGPDTAHEKQADQIGKANSGMGGIKAVAPAVQKMGEEEEEALQMQAEEEEEVVQAQPDAGVVQREPGGRDEQMRRQQLNAEVEAFDPNRLKAPAQQKAPDDDAAAPPALARGRGQDEPMGLVGPAPVDDDAVQMQRDTNVVQREPDGRDESEIKRGNVMDELKGVQVHRKHQNVMNEMKGVQVDRKHKQVMNELKGRGLDDDLQRQPDSVVQREEMPEEELMMQEEEEVVQAQPDTGVVQRQPDTSGVVQRIFGLSKAERDEKKKRKDTKAALVKEMKDAAGDQTERGNAESKMKSVFGKDAVEDVKKEEAKKKVTDSKDKKKKNKDDIAEIKKNIEKWQKKAQLGDPGAFQSLRDEEKKLEDAQKTLEDTKEEAKSISGTKEYKQEEKRKKKEAEQAKKAIAKKKDGDQQDAEKGPSKMAKFGKGALGLAKGFFGSAAKDLKTQLFGEEEKKEEKKEEPKPSPVTVMNVGGGGGGGFSMLEKYINENRDLKDQVAELQAKLQEKDKALVPQK